MNKPTLFFSHSSKDKDVVLAIKNKVLQYTSNTIEIFQSSDGESIPFGTNWIHKIEEGLDSTKVMFVFVTENSISSGWIYFEAGYAYSKGIHVIPVGFGVSIGDLKAPLNLLQGYNITSEDSLNNFISIINREFNYDFAEQFSAKDYDEIVSLSAFFEKSNCTFHEIIRSVNYLISSEYYDESGSQKTRDTKKIFDSIKDYLDTENFNYALNTLHRYGRNIGFCIAVQGIKFTYKLKGASEDLGTIHISISPYNFEKSFELYLKLAKACIEIENAWIQLRLKDNLNYKTSDEDCAALLMEFPDLFSLSKTRVGSFYSEKLGLHFSIYDTNDNRDPDYVLGIGYNVSNTKANSITELVCILKDLQIIERNGEKKDG